MMQSFGSHEALKNLFAGYTEHAFMSEMGVADIEMIDYLTDLLARFIHRDSLFKVEDKDGKTTQTLEWMIKKATDPATSAADRKKYYQRIGDITLFWTGVFPERLKSSLRSRKHGLMEFTEQGKKSYLLASTFIDSVEEETQAPVFKRLSNDFELCQQGLWKARSSWENYSN